MTLRSKEVVMGPILDFLLHLESTSQCIVLVSLLGNHLQSFKPDSQRGCRLNLRRRLCCIGASRYKCIWRSSNWHRRSGVYARRWFVWSSSNWCQTCNTNETFSGYSWKTNQHGLAVDNVLAFQLVKPNGKVVQVTQASDPELFFGLKGGQNNFVTNHLVVILSESFWRRWQGVVTSFTLKAFPQTPVWVSTAEPFQMDFINSKNTVGRHHWIPWRCFRCSNRSYTCISKCNWPQGCNNNVI